MALAKNLGHHQNTRHIHVKYHFIQEMVALHEVDLKFMPTKEQVANMLTKPLGHLKFPSFISNMDMI